ncbi:MAG: DUF3168 domain-containing protein [Pseudomonadota bacterium]
MDMEGALRARLLAAAPVNALVAGRVYWEDRPQGSVLPDITLTPIDDARPQTMDGFQSFRPTQVQIDVRATTFSQKKALTEAVIAAVTPRETSNGIRFDRAADIRPRSLNERTDTQFIYRTAIDLIVWHSPA